jgi:DNA-binding response OmpR family regulator
MRRSEPKDDRQDVLNYKDGRLEIDIEKHRVLINGEQVRLTPVEFQVLAYLVGNAGRVIPYQQILLSVWSANHKGKFDYVHVYISHLRNKLEKNPKKPRYIRSVHKVGYIFEK